jgi:hypothetical protein
MHRPTSAVVALSIPPSRSPKIHEQVGYPAAQAGFDESVRYEESNYDQLDRAVAKTAQSLIDS